MTIPPDDLYGRRDGDTFDPDRDTDRLNRQAADVFRVIADEQWHTLAELAARTGHPEASISARLRDLRKPRFGARVIERRYVGDGLHEYRYAGTTTGAEMTNRTRGDYLERQTRDALRAHNWWVIRAAGSHGVADLVALRKGFRPLLIACKTNGVIAPAERQALLETAREADARPVMASRPEGRRGVVEISLVQFEGTKSIDLVKVPPRAKRRKTTKDDD